jgi:hypothetical protein
VRRSARGSLMLYHGCRALSPVWFERRLARLL